MANDVASSDVIFAVENDTWLSSGVEIDSNSFKYWNTLVISEKNCRLASSLHQVKGSEPTWRGRLR